MAVRIIAAGDSFITRRLPEKGYEGFEELAGLIRTFDAAFVNLESTFQWHEGTPAATSGGTWAMSPPETLDDIRRFGFNLFNTANNHTGDYSQDGVLATLRHLEERQMVYAGTGRNLTDATRAAMLETPKGRVAMVGVTATFAPEAAAGTQGPDVKGRPGLNPLRFKRIHHVNAQHFIEQHGLAQKFLERTVNLAAEAGACSFEMVAADGTFIEAPSSTKNKAHARDPEMASGKKANTWHFGMKEHIAACSESGIIYGTVAAPANEHDITHLGDLLKGLEKMVFLDSGYIGCAKRAEIQAIPFKDMSWYIAAKPSAWKKELSISENFGGELGQAIAECVNVKRQLEHAKASVRCSIEWSFLWLKRIYGYAKVRYRGLAKNHSRAQTLFALYNCYRLRKWCAPPKLPC